MRVLVPIDGSETSERALRFAAEFSRRFDGSLHVVHVTDQETEATELIVERAEEILAEEGVPGESSVSLDLQLTFRSANRVGDDIVNFVEEGDYDHVVMGHHGEGALDRLIIGSAAETVVRGCAVPVTVVP